MVKITIDREMLALYALIVFEFGVLLGYFMALALQVILKAV